MSRPGVRWMMIVLTGMIVLAWGATASRTDPPPGKLPPAALPGGAPPVTGAAPRSSEESPAEKTHKALDKPMALDFNKQPLAKVLDDLRKQTKLNFVVDENAVTEDGDNPFPITAKYQQVKLRTGLRLMLNPHQLDYAIVGDAVIITTPEVAVEKQLGQLVDVSLDEVEARQALQRLARQTATNIVMDIRAADLGQTPVTVHLEDVALETAVRLVAEMASLKLVKVGKVLFVTAPQYAAALQAELEGQPAGPATGAAMQGGLGGLMGGGGALGGLGLGRFSGGFQGASFTPVGGLLGAQGGFGFGGGLGSGRAILALPQDAGQPPRSNARPATPPRQDATPPAQAKHKPGIQKDEPKKPATPAAKPEPAKSVPEHKRAMRGSELIRKLAQPVDIPEDFSSNTPFNQIVDWLQQRTKVPIRSDVESFKNDVQINDVDVQPVKLPRMTQVPLRTVLRMLVAQVQGAYDVRDGMVVISTQQQLTGEQALRRPVDAVFFQQSLNEALQELSDQSGVNIILDAQGKELASFPVTAKLSSVPVETAVGLLADMANLKAVSIDNVIYVTSDDKAGHIQEQGLIRRKPGQPAAQ